MDFAYQESLYSINEHKHKPDPLVGAILTSADGKILATSHRGELRIGEHCEFTLIERKLKWCCKILTKPLPNSYLFLPKENPALLQGRWLLHLKWHHHQLLPKV